MICLKCQQELNDLKSCQWKNKSECFLYYATVTWIYFSSEGAIISRDPANISSVCLCPRQLYLYWAEWVKYSWTSNGFTEVNTPNTWHPWKYNFCQVETVNMTWICELLHSPQLDITHYMFPVSKHTLAPQLTTALKSLSDLALGLFRDLHVLKTAVFLHVFRGWMHFHRCTVKTCIMKITCWPVMTG